MSKYGTIPASSSPAPTSKDKSTGPALHVPVPGSCAAAANISRRRPWRELADGSALSVPGSFADAEHRARANLARFADNYRVVFLVVLSVSLLLLWWPPVNFRHQLSIVLPCFFGMWVSPPFTPLMLFLLVQNGATKASVLVSVAVALLLVLPHAVLHQLPTDRVHDEEEGQGSASATSTPSATN